jgi:hypothetical protein
MDTVCPLFRADPIDIADGVTFAPMDSGGFMFMKRHQANILFSGLLGFALAGTAGAQGPRGVREALAGTETTVSGTISQFNYDRDAEVEGFLLSDKTLVHLPPQAAGRLALSMHAGDNVQVTGNAQTSAARGFRTIEAQAVQDRSSGKTFALPQPGAGAPYSGSGRIQQFNYGPDGAINGLVFDNSTLATMPPFSAANPSSLRVGSTVAYSGHARTTISGRTVVDTQSLTINGQTISLGRPDAPPPPPAEPRRRAAAPPPAMAAGPNPPPPPAAPATPQPAGRTEEPPPPQP